MSWSQHQDPTGTAAWRRTRSHILDRDKHTCQQCARPGNHVDHITPQYQGGNNTPNNLRTLCQQCHMTKSGREGRAARTARAAAKHAAGLGPKHRREQHPGIIN